MGADALRCARFPGTVVNGLALQRALAASGASPQLEAEVRDDANPVVLRHAPTVRGAAGVSSSSTRTGSSSSTTPCT